MALVACPPVSRAWAHTCGQATSATRSLWVYEAADGVLVVYNGVTRATRITRPAPGTTVRVEVVGKLRRAYSGEPKIGDSPP